MKHSSNVHEFCDSEVRKGLFGQVDGVAFLEWAEKTLKERSIRTDFLPFNSIVGEPCWDMLLDLTVARIKGVRVSISSACIASGTPPTTAIRWLAYLQQIELIERSVDEFDRRRSFVSISDKGFDIMHNYYRKISLIQQQYKR